MMSRKSRNSSVRCDLADAAAVLGDIHIARRIYCHRGGKKDRRIHCQPAISGSELQAISCNYIHNSIRTHAHHHQIARIRDVVVAVIVHGETQAFRATQRCVYRRKAIARKKPVGAGDPSDDSLPQAKLSQNSKSE
jgi:hypothetical protein